MFEILVEYLIVISPTAAIKPIKPYKIAYKETA